MPQRGNEGDENRAFPAGAAGAFIPFNRPAVVAGEEGYLQEVLRGGHHSGDGDFTRRCHQAIRESLGVERVLLTTSCTHALEMAALLLDIRPGDEVVVPSFTFVSTVNAFVLRGATPVFCDVRPDTLNLNENELEGLLTERTRAVVPVHYAGVGCEMDALMPPMAQRRIAVVEDNAHGLFGSYKGRLLGTFGGLATLSFHETKNISCGEGGALLVNDPALFERAEILREKGTNRSRFFRGQVDKYTWVDIGSSYLPSDILAALLLGQLEAREEIQARRKRIWDRYDAGLRDWAAERGVRQPIVPPDCIQAYHMYYLLLPDLGTRQAFLKHLKERDILSVFHYLPLHLSPMGRSFGGREGQCPVTEDVSDRLARLPFYTMLSEADQDRVIDAILRFEVG